MKGGFIFLFIIGLASASFSQQNASNNGYLTACKIVFDVTYPDAQPNGTTDSNIPASRVVYLKNELMRVETKMTDGHMDVVIVDCQKKIAHALKEVSGKKYAVKSTPEDVQKECNKIPYDEIRDFDEFKVIAGYQCQKNGYLITDSNHVTFKCDIYTNFKIVVTQPNWFIPQFRDVARFMFEYSIKQDGIEAKISAKSVEPLTENDHIFKIPFGYKPVTKEEFLKLHPSPVN